MPRTIFKMLKFQVLNASQIWFAHVAQGDFLIEFSRIRVIQNKIISHESGKEFQF